MAYAEISDVQERMTRAMTADEQAVCSKLLDDAAVIIDAYNAAAPADAKLVVSCRMVVRALGDGGAAGYPMGATQGSMSGLGYSQSWTMSAGGGVGELYIGKLDKKLLGAEGRIGSYSPVEELAAREAAT